MHKTCHVHVGIHAWNARVFELAREWCEPTLGAPLEGICTPKRGVCVTRPEIDNDDRALRDGNLCQVGAVIPADWLLQGEDRVSPRAAPWAALVVG